MESNHISTDKYQKASPGGSTDDLLASLPCPDSTNGGRSKSNGTNCTVENSDQEEITLDVHVPKKRPSMLSNSKQRRKRSLRKLMRRLSSDSNLTGGSSNSMSSCDVSLTELKSKMDDIELSLEKMQINGAEALIPVDEFLDSALKKFVASDEENENDGDSECSEILLEDTVDKIKELLGVLKTTEWESMRSVQSTVSDKNDESKQNNRRNSSAYLDGGDADDDDDYYDDNDDNCDKDDDQLAEMFEKSPHGGIYQTEESVADVFENASMLPLPLLPLKNFLREEQEKLKKEFELKSTTNKSNRNERNPIHARREVADKNSIFRDNPGGKKRSSLLKKGIFALLSKESFDHSSDKDTSDLIKQPSKLPAPYTGNSENDLVLDNDCHQPLHSTFNPDEIFPPLDEISDEELSQDQSIQEAFIMHFVFRKFSTPAPSYKAVKRVLEYEQRRISHGGKSVHSNRRQNIHSNSLPQDVVVNVGNSPVRHFMGSDDNDIGKSTSLVASVLEGDVLFKLPLHFRLAFLRILIRLLTSESENEYDCALSLEPYIEKVGNMGAKAHRRSSSSTLKDGLKVSSTKSWMNEDLSYLYERNRKRHNLSYDSLYSVVRLCCSERPGKHIDTVIGMIERLMEPSESESRKSKSLLVGPLCRLLGLLCTTGISPKQLKKMLAFIRDDTFRMNVNAHVLKSLIVATEGSSLAKKLRGKASPQSFFNIGRSGGISKIIYPALSTKGSNGWPFKTSFGMACWFRLEGFQSQYERGVAFKQNLLKICSGDGTAFEVSFKMLPASSHSPLYEQNDAAHIIFSVRDSDKSRKVAKAPLSRCIELSEFPIIPRVWFHIAIRHSKKSYLSLTKDEVTILLDGKPMLTEQLKFPKSSTQNTESSQSKQQPLQPIEITYCSGLDAEAGSLYVFDDAISDETFFSLYKFTSGISERVQRQSEQPGIIATIEKKVNPLHMPSFIEEDTAIMTLKKADVEELVIPRARSVSAGGPRSSGRIDTATATTLDLIGDDEFCNEIHNPTKGEFSRQAFVSKLYFVWDPSRVTDDNLVLEAHSSIHVGLDGEHCIPWKMHCAKDVISCVGGIQCLLPVFGSLICPDAGGQHIGVSSEIGSEIPLAFSLLAAFLRDNDNNGREWIRCGGTEILERFLIKNKERYASSRFTSYRSELWIHMNGFRRYLHFAEELVSILFDLIDACSYNSYLESKISSRLVFNFDLWFGGLSKVPGTALHAVLMPALSSLAKADPVEAACSMRTGLMVNLIREYTFVPVETEGNGCFDSMSYTSVMTVSERSHLVDVVMGMLLVILSVEVKTPNLLPLIQFISFNLDWEWETINSPKEGEDGIVDMAPETRRQRFDAAEKACSLLVILLQSRPAIPGLFETLNQIVGDTVSWILCCMVNSYDDKMRSNGIRCFTSLYDAILVQNSDEPKLSSSITILGAKRAVSKVSRTIKNVGAGLGVLPKVFDTSARSLNVSYKLLWQFLKCHCRELGANSYAALVNLLVLDEAFEDDSDFILSKYVISDNVLQNGYRYDHKLTDIRETPLHSPSLKLRNMYACSSVFELLRYLPSKEQEHWLFDLLTLSRVNNTTIQDITNTRDWQHCLFHVASDTVEELSNYNARLWEKEHSGAADEWSDNDENNVHSRFDLSFQLYATLLGHCLRDDNRSMNALELAASLQRVCVNGVSVFSILLSHVLNDLITNGTSTRSAMTTSSDNDTSSENCVLQDCAMAFFRMEVGHAAKHWKKLRHITAIIVATATSNGYGLVNLFDYRDNISSIVDDNSGGVFGIRLSDRSSAGILSSDVMAGTRLLRNEHGTSVKENEQSKKHYRIICTTLSSQVLELLDPYIFPDHVDIATSSSQQQVLSLIRSIEPRLGSAQGPLVTSLVRLSLLLLNHLEPSCVKFLKSCSMLRCFLHWSLDMVRSQSEPFQEVTGSIDRIIVCIVLQCHRSLSKCSSVLTELELSPGKYFSRSEETRNLRRLFRAVETLGDIVLDVYKGRNCVLLQTFSQDAYKALELSIATKDEWANNVDLNGPNTQDARKVGIREFLKSDWIQKFHDNNYVQADDNAYGDIAIPEQLKVSAIEPQLNVGDLGAMIMNGLAVESKDIAEEYICGLNTPFLKYLEDQKRWADTSAVRDLEYDGNLSIKNLAEQYLSNSKEMVRTEMLKADLASQRLISIERKIRLEVINNHWKLAQHTDRLHRRVLLVPNRNFNDHASASYDLALGIEREKALKEREERLRAKKQDELAQMYQLAKQGIVKQILQVDELMKEDPFVDICDSESDCDFNSSDSDGQCASIGPLSDDDVIPGELITDWDRIEADEIILDAKHEKGSYMWARDYIWQHGERLVLYLDTVNLVTTEAILTGEIVLTTHSLYFRPTEDPISVMTKETVVASAMNLKGSLEGNRWRLNRLTEVHERRYMLRKQAIELFFADTHEVFINFCAGLKVRDNFVEKLRQCKTPLVTLSKTLNPKSVFKRRFPGLTQQWQQRKISNFEYLMQLNIMAGRTFNDVSQYPVFPWILADYTSEDLDLTNPKSFRDLTKPVGALNPDRLMQLLERYHDLDGLPEEERFLYGSHYSSPGAVLHFLIRQEPFTTMAIELQSGRFDCPDRLFYDIAACWQSCLQSTSDVKELVPELFTCPEIFLNTNNFPLGETQSKNSTSNVKLPPWANGSAHEFIRLNRLALESEYVSDNLHHWIDLIFGYNQRGLNAIKSNNVFHFLSYEGAVDLDKITDELDRRATESQIQNFGQTPSQILSTAHPKRFPAKKCWKPIISEISSTRRLMCYTPFKQFGGNRTKNKHGPVVSIQLLVDNVVVVYADLSVGIYKWAPTKHGKTPFYLKMDKIRPIASREMSISKFAMGVQSIPEASNPSYDSQKANIGIGNWSFAMTMGNTAYDASKTTMGKIAKTKDVSSNSIDVTLISCGYWDNAIKAHALDGLRLKCSETGGHLGPVNCLRLGENGVLLITGGADATCRVWTVENSDMGSALIDSYVKTAQEISSNSILTCCLVLWGHGSPISSLAFDTDLDIVVSGSMDGMICIHTVRRGDFIRSLQVANFFPPANILKKNFDEVTSVRKLAIHKDGGFVAHLETGLLQMYTINGAKLGCIDAGEKLHAMEMIPGGHSLVTGGESGHVIIRSLRNLGIRYVLDLSDYGPIHCITFTPPPLHSKSIQQFMFVGTQDGSITVACAQREESNDEDDDEESSSAQYTQHQALKKQETKSWWR